VSKKDLLGASETFEVNVGAAGLSNRGQALASLVGEPLPTPEPVVLTDGVVPIELVDNNPYNPRTMVAAVQNMADSIEQLAHGLLSPLTVVTRDAFLVVFPEAGALLAPTAVYVVIDGNRRLAGARLAGLDQVPVHVDNSLAADRDTVLKAILLADAQHEQLPTLDQSAALQQFLTAHGSQRKVARALGKSQSWVSKRLALLNLAPALAEAVSTGELSVEIAAQVAQYPQEEQPAALERELAERAKARGNTGSDSDGITLETAGTSSSASRSDSVGITPPPARTKTPASRSDSDGITPTPAASPSAVPHQSQREAEAADPELPDVAAGDSAGITPPDGTPLPSAPDGLHAWLRVADLDDIADRLIAAIHPKDLTDLLNVVADKLRSRQPAG
jgi:ParB family chromosome partitioning protein